MDYGLKQLMGGALKNLKEENIQKRKKRTKLKKHSKQTQHKISKKRKRNTKGKQKTKGKRKTKGKKIRRAGTLDPTSSSPYLQTDNCIVCGQNAVIGCKCVPQAPKAPREQADTKRSVSSDTGSLEERVSLSPAPPLQKVVDGPLEISVLALIVMLWLLFQLFK